MNRKTAQHRRDTIRERAIFAVGAAGLSNLESMNLIVTAAPKPIQQPHVLTQRELQVVEAIADGSTNQEAARKLHIHPKTVATHLHSAFVSLGCTNRVEAIMICIDHGLLDVDDLCRAVRERIEPSE